MLPMIWKDQMDFVLFVYGMAFLLMAVVCVALRRQERAVPWKYLALFGLTHGAGEWLDMLALGLADSSAFAMARLALKAVSFAFLLEFGRIGNGAPRARAVWPWIILCLAGLTALGVQDGLPGVTAAVRYGLALPGTLWAGLALLRAARMRQHGSLCLSVAAGAMLLYGLAAGLVTPPATLPPASIINNDIFLSFTGFPVQVVRCLLTGALACVFWIRYEANRSDLQPRRHGPVAFVLALLVLLGAGWYATQWTGQRQNARQLAGILDLAQRTALAISPEHVKDLAGSSEDLGNLNYRRLKEQLKTMRARMQQVRFLYLLRRLEGRAVFLADSEPVGGRDESQPGEVYEQASPGLLSILISGSTYIEGPLADKWGTWFSGFAPIRDRRTGRLLAVLGVDQDARLFSAAVGVERLKAICLTALFCLVLLLSFVCRRRFREALMQPRLSLASDLLLRWGLPTIIVLIGTALSLTAFMENRRSAQDAFQAAFRQQAALQAEAISLELDRQMDSLDGLRRFWESEDSVDRDEFARFVASVKERFPVQAVEWVPRVRGGERAYYEASARQEGLAEFRITEKDPSGSMITAPDRDQYFPAYYVEPLQGNEATVGLDLASEPLRRAAIWKACDQGHAAVTQPLRLVQETGRQTGVLVFAPVYGRGALPPTVEKRRQDLKGFVVAVYRIGDFMQGALAGLSRKALPFVLEDLSASPENRLLYSHAQQARAAAYERVHFEMQMDIAGRDWQITIEPNRDFVESNMSRNYWFMLAGGLLLTALLTLYMNNLVTGRFRAEDLVRRQTSQLQESEERFKYAMSGTREGIWDWNIAEGASFYSRQWKEMLGYRDEEITSSTAEWEKRVHPDDMPMVRQALDRHFQGQTEMYEIEYRLMCSDGSWKWILGRGSVIERAADGRPLRMVGTQTDISQRKDAEQKLKQILAELKRSNEELEQFAYVSSHDLQEPLRMIVSYLQLLERRYKGRLDADADEFIGFAVDGAHRMQTLINDLLAYSRVTTKGRPFEPTDCRDAVQGACANLKLRIDETGSRIEYGQLPTVLADSSQLTQLFQNLIGNALKYRSLQPPRISIEAELRDREWLFSVQDNGIGIEPRYFERIFVIFQRLHSRSEHSGTGIGLAVCKKIVERHGGIIWVSSEPGTGSTFYFTIPAGDVNQGPAIGARSEDSSSSWS